MAVTMKPYIQLCRSKNHRGKFKVFIRHISGNGHVVYSSLFRTKSGQSRHKKLDGALQAVKEWYEKKVWYGRKL